MAFTAENSHDAYLFFVLAFGAAPGKEFGGQIYQAYDAGATTQQIVNTYATKPQFKDMYPDTQTSAEFAAALINNVVGNTASDAAKAQAVADIVAAMGNGLGKGDVIYAILGNLSKMDTANADWGKTVAMLNNKIAVAKALTEGAHALNTTDLDLLKTPLAGVTDDLATVQKAINAAGDLATKLDNLAAAKTAASDYAAQVKADLKDASITDLAKAKTALENQALGASGDIKAGGLSSDAATKAAEIQLAVAEANAQQKADSKALADCQAAAAKVVNSAGETLLAVVNAANAAADKLTAAVNAKTLSDNAEVKALADIQVKDANAAYAAPGSVDGYDATTKIVTGAGGATTIAAFDTTKKVFVFDLAATAEQKALYQPLVDAANAQYLALKGVEDAGTVKTAADGKVTTFAPSASSPTLVDAFAGVKDASGNPVAANAGAAKTALATDAAALKTANDAIKTLNDNIAIVNGVGAKLDQIKALQSNIDAANKAFTDAGYAVPVEVKATLFATTGDDVYLSSKDTLAATLYVFAGKDVIYAGKGYELNTTGDLTKGDDAKLEVFFKTNGTGTDVYIEQKAFGSHVAGAADATKDIAKITLVGVTADKLVFKDGFISITA